MAVFDGVSVTLDETQKHLTLNGNATLATDTPFEGTAVVKANDGSTENLTFAGTRSVVTDDGGTLESVSDNLGGNWTIASDGRTADEA